MITGIAQLVTATENRLNRAFDTAFDAARAKGKVTA